MDNSQFAKYQQVGQIANQTTGSINQPPAPRTIASAQSRMDGLNERLMEVRNHLGGIADAIGGPRPANGEAKASLPSAGAVGRLNDAVEAGHCQVAEIHELLAAISRALG